MVDFREVFDRNEPSLDSLPDDTQAIWGEARTKFDAKFAEHGVDPKGKHLEVADMAKELGCEREYFVLFRFLSKFVHASALLICVADVPESTFDSFYAMGCGFFNEANERLNRGLSAKNRPWASSLKGNKMLSAPADKQSQ